MTDRISYREGTRADIGAIVDFQLRMARETEDVELDSATLHRGVGAVFDTPVLGRYFIAELDGNVVASLLITYEWSDWRARTVWWIQSVFVVPEARRKGIYAGLYRHVLELSSADETIAGIRLYVDRRNVPAQEVYTKLGMNGEHYLVFERMKE